ncbi:hypothetical protein DVK02_18110, partial [Halobellus sp. Atlit-31R]
YRRMLCTCLQPLATATRTLRLSAGNWRRVVPHLEQLIEEHAVMHHRIAQLFSGGFAARIASGNELGSTVILYNRGVVDRNVGRTMFKIGHWISACRHELANQLIGLGDDASWIIDETGLQIYPRLTEPGSVGW